MSLTMLSSVSSHTMSEVLARLALKPLRSKYVYLPLVNTASIDGNAANNRKIPKRTQIAIALDDTEGVEFTGFEPFNYGTPIVLTPTGKIAGIEPTVKALRRLMPGATRDQVIAAVQSGSADALAALSMMAEEIITAHYRRAEQTGLALFPNFNSGTSKGTTNVALSTTTLVDSQTALFSNNPEHHIIACVVSDKGVGDIRKELITGSGVGLAALWGNGAGDEFNKALGDAAPSSAPYGFLVGMPLYGADVGLMTTANGGVDTVGATFCVGRGETAAAGSLRGAAELCEGHNLSIGTKYELESDTAKAIGRYEWDFQEHTDEHGIPLIFKKT